MSLLGDACTSLHTEVWPRIAPDDTTPHRARSQNPKNWIAAVFGDGFWIFRVKKQKTYCRTGKSSEKTAARPFERGPQRP